MFLGIPSALSISVKFRKRLQIRPVEVCPAAIFQRSQIEIQIR